MFTLVVLNHNWNSNFTWWFESIFMNMLNLLPFLIGPKPNSTSLLAHPNQPAPSHFLSFRCGLWPPSLSMARSSLTSIFTFPVSNTWAHPRCLPLMSTIVPLCIPLTSPYHSWTLTSMALIYHLCHIFFPDISIINALTKKPLASTTSMNHFRPSLSIIPMPNCRSTNTNCEPSFAPLYLN